MICMKDGYIEECNVSYFIVSDNDSVCVHA